MSASSYFSELTGEFRWTRLIPSLTVGLIIGIVEVVLAISFAALIFSGPLSPFLGNGIGVTLMGAILSGAAVALMSSVPGIVSGNQDIPAALLAVAAVAIANAMPAGAAARELFVNVVVLTGLTTALTGAFFYGLAHFGLGNLVRFLPYPVVGGFLASTGWVLLLGGIGIMVDVSPSLETVPLLLQPMQLLRWLPGVALAATMFFVLRHTEHPLALPAVVFGSMALFYAIATLVGGSATSLSTGGWLLGPFPAQTLWQPLAISDLSLVNWPAIATQTPNIVTVLLMSAIALLLNSSGVELALANDLSLNRELRAAGIGNLLAGLCGGLVSFQQLSLSVMNNKVAGGSRLAGLFAVTLCVLVLFLGASVLSLFPKLVLGALIFFIGLSFLHSTLVDDWHKLPRTDYLLIVLILLVAAAVGFMEAVGVGLLVAVILFVLKYSRTEIIRNELSGRTAQSRVTRSPEKSRVLEELGPQLVVLRLQGFIFFGTADSLVSRVRDRLENPQRPRPRFLLLDFHHVTGVDSTALLSFSKLFNLARQHRVSLVLTEPLSELHRQIDRHLGGDETVRIFPSLDHGLEWCEEQLLSAISGAGDATDQLQQELARRLDAFGDTAARLLAYFERKEVREGHVLMLQGDDSDNLYIVESGQMTAYLQEEEGARTRLQTMQDWNVLGEIGFFLNSKRTASVIAEAPGVVYCLSRQALETMQQEEPEVASVLHHLIVQLLAERVVHLVSVVDALRR